jgi:pimeloyl-ACP methyl ester carboxylesterase
VQHLTIKRLPGVSHWVHHDVPQVLNDLLRKFLDAGLARDWGSCRDGR